MYNRAYSEVKGAVLLFSGLRNFIVIFLIALIGFGVAGHFLATSIIPSLISGDGDTEISDDNTTSEESGISGIESEESVPAKESGEGYSFAVLCLDLKEELSSVFFVHTNDGYETCVYTTIPGKIPLENNGAESTLARIYKDNGAEFFLEKLRFITGYQIDGYAVLNAVDTTGNGRSITDLATHLNYTCKITVPFSYPNPNYIEPSLDSSEVFEDSSTEASTDESFDFETSEELISEDETSAPDTSSEFIVIQPGDYALNGFIPLNGQADKLQNYLVLLESQYNIYAHEIYTDVLKKVFVEKAYGTDSKAFDYFSVLKIDKETAMKHLFNDFEKFEYKYPETAEAWNEAVAALRELEMGENK